MEENIALTESVLAKFYGWGVGNENQSAFIKIQ